MQREVLSWEMVRIKPCQTPATYLAVVGDIKCRLNEQKYIYISVLSYNKMMLI
jgi:hypothetical protein